MALPSLTKTNVFCISCCNKVVKSVKISGINAIEQSIDTNKFWVDPSIGLDHNFDIYVFLGSLIGLNHFNCCA